MQRYTRDVIDIPSLIIFVCTCMSVWMIKLAYDTDKNGDALTAVDNDVTRHSEYKKNKHFYFI